MEPGQQCSCDWCQWERAGSPPLYLGHASPTCSAGQTLQSNGCNTIQGLGLRVWGLRAPQRSGFKKGDLGVGLRPLEEHVGASDCISWSLLVRQGGGLDADGSFSQAEESTVIFEHCTGASVTSGSPLGDEHEHVGELKASSGGCQVVKT